MRFDTVYYSHFWYSRFASVTAQDGDFPNEERQHRTNFRLLSLFFPKIYIPRTHLLTQLYEYQWEVPSNLFTSRDVGYLTEAGSLAISTYPGLDPSQDNERIISRSSLTDDVVYAMTKGFLERIPATEKFIIPSLQEAASNKLSFPKYGRWLYGYNPAVAHRFAEIMKSSELGEIPFFHEAFVSKLRGYLDKQEFEKVWRDTNSMYLIAGGPNQPSLIPYYNYRIESIDYRHEPLEKSIDRYLFSPETLYTFLGLWLDPKEMERFILGPIEQSCSYLNPDIVPPSALAAFRESYFQVADAITVITRQEEFKRVIQQPVMDRLFRSAYQLSSDQLEAYAQDAKGLVDAVADSASAATFGLAKPLAKYAKGLFRQAETSWRHGAILTVINAMKKQLRLTA